MDADLLQGSTHAIGAQFRRLDHQLPHFIDLLHASFARGPLRYIIEARVTKLSPAFEYFIHPVARRLQVGTDSSRVPAFRVQIDNGSPPLVRVGDLGIGWIAPPGNARPGSVTQDPLDRVIPCPAPLSQKTTPSP